MVNGIRMSKVIIVGLSVFGLLPFFSQAGNNIQFTGALFDRSCIVDSASLDQEVIFPTQAYHDFLILPANSPTVGFAINLVNCYADDFGKVVKVTFSGAAESSLPGHVAVQGNNAGKLAVGLIDTDGLTLLPLGTTAKQGLLVGSDQMTLPFKAFVQATPEAIQQKSVVPGIYIATVQFKLSYE